MKLENIDITTAETKELVQQFAALGISNSRLDGAVSSMYLPENGTFVDYAVANPLTEEQQKELTKGLEKDPNFKLENNFAHIVVIVNDENGNESQISLSRLQLQAVENYDETKKEDYFKKSAKGKFYMVGKAINPLLSGNQVTVLKNILGKSFTSELVNCTRMKFNAKGYTTLNSCEVEPVQTYKVNLIG